MIVSDTWPGLPILMSLNAFSSVGMQNPQYLCSPQELLQLSIFICQFVEAFFAKQEWQWSKYQLQKMQAQRITVISNCILNSDSPGMHQRELHMRCAVERARKPGRLATYWVLDSCFSDWTLSKSFNFHEPHFPYL